MNSQQIMPCGNLGYINVVATMPYYHLAREVKQLNSLDAAVGTGNNIIAGWHRTHLDTLEHNLLDSRVGQAMLVKHVVDEQGSTDAHA